MNKKLSIITSSIAACAIFASLFAFNGYATGSSKVETPKVESVVTTVKSAIGTQQPVKTPCKTATTNTKASVTTSDTKAVNVNTPDVKSSQNNSTCPKTKQAQGTNNQQTTNIKSADIISNLQSNLYKSNCNKTNAKTNNYSAIQSKIDALLKSIYGTSATKPTSNTTTAKPTTSKPAASTPAAKPATSTTTTGTYSAFQKEVVRLVNVERAKNGLKPLTMNTSLSKTATLKSQDMAKLNYFDHTSPTYGSPFDMMKNYGISYRTAGENIAMGQTSPAQVMQGWMNSPGHRANILNSSFTQIGVGVAKNSSGRLYWTQQFIG